MSPSEIILKEAAELRALGEMFLQKATKLEVKIQQELGSVQTSARRPRGLNSKTVATILGRRTLNKTRRGKSC